MIDSILGAANGHQIYESRSTQDDVPFRVSPNPLRLSQLQINSIKEIGFLVTQYMNAVRNLYFENQTVREILDAGKPEEFKGKNPRYLFVRPDLILTKDGFKICEIEVSPFGLALSDILTRAYADQGAIGDPELLRSYASSRVAPLGKVVYSEHTEKFAGQLRYLAKEIFASGNDLNWEAVHVAQLATMNEPEAFQFYRGFYLHEAANNPELLSVCNLDDSIPTSTTFYEEKAAMALIWDSRFARKLKLDLGRTEFEQLRNLIPPTWLLGQEQFFEPGLPNGATDTAGVAALGKSARKIVIKTSGYSDAMSWGHGVEFLDKMTTNQAVEYVRSRALLCMFDSGPIYVAQQYCDPVKLPFSFYDSSNGGEIVEQDMGSRITPYFANMGSKQGELISMKVTGRAGTRFIHGASDSVNTAVGQSLSLSMAYPDELPVAAVS